MREKPIPITVRMCHVKDHFDLNGYTLRKWTDEGITTIHKLGRASFVEVSDILPAIKVPVMFAKL